MGADGPQQHATLPEIQLKQHGREKPEREMEKMRREVGSIYSLSVEKEKGKGVVRVRKREDQTDSNRNIFFFYGIGTR